MTELVQDEIAQSHYTFMHKVTGIPQSDPLPDGLLVAYKHLRMASDRAQVGGLKFDHLVVLCAMCGAVRVPVKAEVPAATKAVSVRQQKQQKPERDYELNRPVMVGVAEEEK